MKHIITKIFLASYSHNTCAFIPFLKEWQELKTKLKEVQYSEISSFKWQPTRELQELLIVAEDHRFFYHPGVDPIALIRALWRTMHGKREGGSTLEMQLVRILTGRYERTLKRKIREIILALLLSNVVKKIEIPRLYLHVAYFGWRMNGLRQACIRLREKPVSLSIKDNAELVARLKYPEPKNPSPKRINQIHQRACYILKRHSARLHCPLPPNFGVSHGTISDYVVTR